MRRINEFVTRIMAYHPDSLYQYNAVEFLFIVLPDAGYSTLPTVKPDVRNRVAVRCL